MVGGARLRIREYKRDKLVGKMTILVWDIPKLLCLWEIKVKMSIDAMSLELRRKTEVRGGVGI